MFILILKYIIPEYEKLCIEARHELKLEIREGRIEEGVRLDPYGHAAAELMTNLKHPRLSKQVKKKVQYKAS